MKHHTKIYLQFFGYQIPSDIMCECCGQPAQDINHINARGMGGNPAGDKDDITNLMAMCRDHHTEYGDVPELKPMLRLIHLKYMAYNGLRSMILQLKTPMKELLENAESEVENQKQNK